MVKKLEGLTLAILWPQERDERFYVMIRELAGELIEHGALVFNVAWDGLSGKLLKVMGVRALLGFRGKDDHALRFIYARRTKKESLSLVAVIAKELAKREKTIKMDIAGPCGILRHVRFIKFSLLPLPAVLIESDAAALDADRRAAVISAILNLYGHRDAAVEDNTTGAQAETDEESAVLPSLDYDIARGLFPCEETDEENETSPGSAEETGMRPFLEDGTEQEGLTAQEEEEEAAVAIQAKEESKPQAVKAAEDTGAAKHRDMEKKKHARKKMNTFNPPGGGPVFRFVAEGVREEYSGIRSNPAEPVMSSAVAEKNISWEELCRVADTVKKSTDTGCKSKRF